MVKNNSTNKTQSNKRKNTIITDNDSKKSLKSNVDDVIITINKLKPTTNKKVLKNLGLFLFEKLNSS